MSVTDKHIYTKYIDTIAKRVCAKSHLLIRATNTCLKLCMKFSYSYY